MDGAREEERIMYRIKGLKMPVITATFCFRSLSHILLMFSLFLAGHLRWPFRSSIEKKGVLVS